MQPVLGRLLLMPSNRLRQRKIFPTPHLKIAPLWGGVRGGGSAIPSQVAPPSSHRITPLPDPPPQGGREQTEIAGTNGGNFCDYIATTLLTTYCVYARELP